MTAKTALVSHRAVKIEVSPSHWELQFLSPDKFQAMKKTTPSYQKGLHPLRFMVTGYRQYYPSSRSTPKTGNRQYAAQY